MTAIAAATILAFVAGALLVVVLCVSVSDSAPSDWTDRGRAGCWFWSAVFGVICALLVFGTLPGGAQ